MMISVYQHSGTQGKTVASDRVEWCGSRRSIFCSALTYAPNNEDDDVGI